MKRVVDRKYCRKQERWEFASFVIDFVFKKKDIIITISLY